MEANSAAAARAKVRTTIHIDWMAVIFLIAVALLTYLPLTGTLGYYRDDWHVAWGGRLFGPEKIIDLHLTDRPIMGIFYSLFYRLLGDAPLNWQLFSLGLRAAGGLTFLWLLRLLFPGRRAPTTVMALLFLVYPGFLEMPTSSAYSNHLFGLWMGILSLALSLQALRVPRLAARISLTGAAVLASLACFFVMEYMVSLEIVRLLLMGYVFFADKRVAAGAPSMKWKPFLRRLLVAWLPYAAGWLAFLSWRVFVFKSARSVTDVGSLARSYLDEPGYMIARAVIETVKGALNTIVLAWSVPFYQLTERARNVDLWISLLLALAVIILTLFFLRRAGAELRTANDPWQRDAVVLGLVVALINLIPIVLANRDIRFSDTFDRYTLPASLGAVMIVAGLLYRLRPAPRAALLGVLLAVSVITQFNNAAYFRNFWQYQRELWWQLAWRAPALARGTVLMPVLPDGYRLAESYEVWGPANLIYGSAADPQPVVGEALSEETLPSLMARQSFQRTMRRVTFTLDFKNALILSLPSPSACLHVVDGAWLELGEEESPLVRLAAPYSRIGLINTDGEPVLPPEEIFGAEPVHGWCYYYQKASLERQRGDWAAVASLGDEVRALGLQPHDPLEWLPFYMGYAFSSRFEDANELANRIRAGERSLALFCTQFGPGNMADLRSGSTDEYIILNLCPMARK